MWNSLTHGLGFARNQEGWNVDSALTTLYSGLSINKFLSRYQSAETQCWGTYTSEAHTETTWTHALCSGAEADHNSLEHKGHSILNQPKIKSDPSRFLSNLVRSEYL